jgi:hypothetical protein
VLTFSGTVILFCTVTSTTKFPIRASSIVLSDTSLTITTPQNRVFGVGPSGLGSLNLSIVYESGTSANSEPLSSLEQKFLQIGNVNLPNSGFWSFCISGIDERYCIDIESKKVKSLLFSVPSHGNYSIRALSEGLMGFLGTEEGLSSFNVGSEVSLIPEVHFIPDRSPSPSVTQTRTETFTVHLRMGCYSRKMWIMRFGWFVFLVE